MSRCSPICLKNKSTNDIFDNCSEFHFVIGEKDGKYYILKIVNDYNNAYYYKEKHEKKELYNSYLILSKFNISNDIRQCYLGLYHGGGYFDLRLLSSPNLDNFNLMALRKKKYKLKTTLI
jgi:hypothetical protein